MTNPLLMPSARSAGRVVVWVLCALLLLAVFAALWIGIRGYQAYGHVRDAQQAAREMRENLTDTEAASAHAADLADHTSAARSLTSDPVWRAAEYLPWVGEQLDAVSTAVTVVDDVASSALGPLVEVAQEFSVDDLRPTDGRINIGELAAVQHVAATSSERIGRAADRIDEIDRGPLLAPVAEQVDEVGEQLRTASTATDAIDRASRLMPAMLGQDGPRNYLLIFQNNAEWRSLGGIVGATALLRTDGGALSLETQVPAAEFGLYDPPVLPLGEERSQLFDDQPARFLSNVTQVPDFTTTGALAQAMWEHKTGQRVNGVISLDPVALSYVLKATGPVTLPTGEAINAENAIPLLLNEVYLRYEDRVQQDELFQATAAMTFDAVSSGAVDPGALIDALTRAADERRVLIWNENEDEQAVLHGTPLEGMPLNAEDDETRFGVFVNDGTASKMNFYTTMTSGASWCRTSTGGTEAVLEVTLRSDAPEPAALTDYVTGIGAVVPRGVSRVVSYFYLPEGAEVSSAVGSDSSGFGRGTDAGRTVLTWETELGPGEEATATVRVSTPFTTKLNVVTTPTIPSNAKVAAPACSVTSAE